MDIKKYLTKTDRFSVPVRIEKLQQHLSNHDFQKFKITAIDAGSYKIQANISAGILLINGSRGIGISTYVTLTPNGDTTKVELKTSPRPEYLLLLFGFGFILLMMLTTGQSWVNLVWTIGLFTLCLVWFRFVLQMQEEALHVRIKTELTHYN